MPAEQSAPPVVEATEAVPGGMVFFCPGCDTHHYFVPGPWTWNGDERLPTVNPSILITCNGPETRCHLFVRNGMLEYLPDCTHALAGKTIPMEPL